MELQIKAIIILSSKIEKIKIQDGSSSMMFWWEILILRRYLKKLTEAMIITWQITLQKCSLRTMVKWTRLWFMQWGNSKLKLKMPMSLFTTAKSFMKCKKLMTWWMTQSQSHFQIKNILNCNNPAKSNQFQVPYPSSLFTKFQ